MSILKGLKVCFLAGTLGHGGAERQLFYQLQTLKLCGAQPLVISFSQNEHWQQFIESIGIQVIHLERNHSRAVRLQKICKILNDRGIDVVQSAHFYLNLYVALASRILDIKAIGTIRSDGFQDVSETGKFLGRISLWLPKNLVVNSHTAYTNAVKLGRSEKGMFYLPNVVDTDRFSPSLSNSVDVFHLVMVGRLAPPKRFDIFLRLMSTLCNKHGLSIIGHVAGDGPDRFMLENLAMSFGLSQDQVQFHGAVTDVECLYQQAYLCLHLSDWEGIPNSIIEAMSCGLPVIASNVGGVSELVKDNQTGFLINNDDVSNLISIVRKLLQNPTLKEQQGMCARNFILNNHSINIMPDFLERLYESVLS